MYFTYFILNWIFLKFTSLIIILTDVRLIAKKRRKSLSQVHLLSSTSSYFRFLKSQPTHTFLQQKYKHEWSVFAIMCSNNLQLLLSLTIYLDDNYFSLEKRDWQWCSSFVMNIISYIFHPPSCKCQKKVRARDVSISHMHAAFIVLFILSISSWWMKRLTSYKHSIIYSIFAKQIAFSEIIFSVNNLTGRRWWNTICSEIFCNDFRQRL